MFKVSATLRIAFGLVSLLTSSLMIASIFGFYPNRREEVMKNRSHVCESMAINFSVLANKNDIETMRRLFESVAERNPEIASIGIRRDDGTLLIEIGEHQEAWNLTSNQKSTDEQFFVEIFADGQLWGKLEIRFFPMDAGFLGRFLRPDVRHALIVSGFSLLTFYLYLRFVLRQLDPSRVVPNRVREALDTLAEGLLVLDHRERIVLANRAFTRSTGTNVESLVGKQIEDLPFISKDETPAASHPWTEAIQTGSQVTGRLFGIPGDKAEERTFSVSASPIHDERGHQRGVLASFEDVSHLEMKKRELKTMVDYLRASSDEIKRQNRELERLATRDPLTGCLNRRAFFERFETEWQESRRHSMILSVAMVDVDHFKNINDTNGHSMGDDVLRRVASVLRENARESDTVCRYGGEEFAILMPGTNLDDAQIVAERLRIAISRLPFPSFSVTASFGISSQSESPQSPQELLDQADKCLYVAKRHGRNQVVRWDHTPQDLNMDEGQSRREKTRLVGPESPSIPFHAVTALISALAYRDHATAEHSRRVADLCVATAEGIMSLSDCYTLEVAALLHDIGKFGVPDSILLKPGRLSDDEWKVMHRNDKIGVEIVRASFASEALTEIIENYQRRFGDDDAAGQSSGGEPFPLGARILAIADAFDSMVTDRVYRKGRTRVEAFAELRRCAGSQFDPELVERFISTIQFQMADRIETSTTSKEAALFIGLQIEGLSKALDGHDLAKLDALSRHLHATAVKHGSTEIAEKAASLEAVLDSDRDLMAIIQIAGELLDLCRATQSNFLSQVALNDQFASRAN